MKTFVLLTLSVMGLLMSSCVQYPQPNMARGVPMPPYAQSGYPPQQRQVAYCPPQHRQMMPQYGGGGYGGQMMPGCYGGGQQRYRSYPVPPNVPPMYRLPAYYMQRGITGY